MEQIQIRDEFIKLGQAMKLAGLVDEGYEAKSVITSGLVTVNGEVDTRRGRKLHPGDTFTYKNQTFEVVSKSV
jgi:ribosome-associated protein